MSWVPFNESLERSWDEFVFGQEAGRMVHLSGFKKAVEGTYHFEPFYRVYIKNGAIKAIFPGFFHKSLIYGRKLLSQPFSEYGGILISHNAVPCERDEILGAFSRLIKKALRVKRFAHLEMRNPMSLGADGMLRFEVCRMFKYAVRRLEHPDAMWRALNSKDRNVIQRAKSYGLTAVEEEGEGPVRRAFYPLYLKTMKRLGTPPHPLGYFLRLASFLKDRMKMFIVYHRNAPVAALIGWAVGKTVHITEMCSDAAAFVLRPNDFAVWEFLSWAYDRGYEVFDFGPVRYRGQEVFKKKWNMELWDYFYAYLSVRPASVQNPFSSSGGVMKAAPELWAALMPVGLGRIFGKRIRKEIGL